MEGEEPAGIEPASGGQVSAAVWRPVSQLVAGVEQLVSQLSPDHGQSGGLAVSDNPHAISCYVLLF